MENVDPIDEHSGEQAPETLGRHDAPRRNHGPDHRLPDVGQHPRDGLAAPPERAEDRQLPALARPNKAFRYPSVARSTVNSAARARSRAGSGGAARTRSIAAASAVSSPTGTNGP